MWRFSSKRYMPLPICLSFCYITQTHTQELRVNAEDGVINQCAHRHILKTVLLLYPFFWFPLGPFVSNFYCNVFSCNYCRTYRCHLLYMHFLSLCSTKTTGEPISWDHPIRFRLNKLPNLGVHRECTLHCLMTSPLAF